jgi:NAD(P)-dependent dehydrogenase (short-subunit alcohol dehydrogenase family)
MPNTLSNSSPFYRGINMSLKDKRIIVTGCSRGMGEATLKAYVAAGAHVVGMDVMDELGHSVVAAANAAGTGTARYLHVDIADRASVEQAFADAVGMMGGLDVLAHPAAIQRSSSASDVTVEDWDLMFAVCVRGTMLTNQVAHRYMKASGGGSIINFGSISGLRPEVSAAAYSAAKGAVHSWTRTAAATWGVDGVRVNAILPAMATPMFNEAVARLDDKGKEAMYWENLHTIAMGKQYGDPEKDLGPVMVFLASDGARFITGQLLPVDGGQTNVR